MLADGFLDGILEVRTLAFDHGKRDAVDEQHNVRSPGLVAARAFDAELFGDVKDVVLPVGPVDVDGKLLVSPSIDCCMLRPRHSRS